MHPLPTQFNICIKMFLHMYNFVHLGVLFLARLNLREGPHLCLNKIYCVVFSFRNCNNVQYLSMAHCKKFTDRGLLYLASGKNNKKLDYLDLSGCLQVSTDTRTLKKICPKQQILHALSLLKSLHLMVLGKVLKQTSKISTVFFKDVKQ